MDTCHGKEDPNTGLTGRSGRQMTNFVLKPKDPAVAEQNKTIRSKKTRLQLTEIKPGNQEEFQLKKLIFNTEQVAVN